VCGAARNVAGLRSFSKTTDGVNFWLLVEFKAFATLLWTKPGPCGMVSTFDGFVDSPRRDKATLEERSMFA